MDIPIHTTMVSEATQLRPEQPEQSVAARYGALIRVLQTIGTPGDPAQLFCRLATALRQVVKCDYIAGGLYDEAANKFDWHLDERLTQRVRGRFPDRPQEETITWWVYHHQESVVMPCFERETRFPSVVDLMKKWGMQSGCTLLLTTVHRRLGVLFLGSEEAEAYSQDDLSFLALVADQIASATEYALHFRVSQAAQDRLKLLLEEGDRANATLGERERELRQIVEAIPQLIIVLAPDGSYLYANERVLEYTGYTQEDVVAGGFRERIFHPDDVERLRDERQQGLARGVPFEMEQRTRRKDGQYRWFLTRFNPLRDEQGRIIRWYATGTDIDDRKQAEERVQNENLALREEIDKASMFEEIVGAASALQAVLARVSKVAPTDSTVLITGETGTGKELIARAIHKRSERASRAFVSVNCAATPLSLIVSELFGHEKGTFTGATQRRLGRFELAEGGTIFLDEIGELPAETQIALLRVLQEREFERVGGNRSIRADVRVIAATNRDLQAAIGAGTFRSDLFYRLNVFPIEVPPLRERREDIPLLVAYFIDRYASKAGKKIRSVNKKTLDLLQSYPWPGNIRELQNVIERSLILCDTETFAVDASWLSRESLPTPPASQVLTAKLATHEKAMIEAALAETRGRVSGPSGAAARLGIPPSTLDRKIRSLQINKHRFKTD